MKKIILVPKSEYDRGTYTLKCLCGTKTQRTSKWQDILIFSHEKNGVIKDLKKEGYQVFEEEYYYPKGSIIQQKRFKRI